MLGYLSFYQGFWFPGAGFVKDKARDILETNGQPMNSEFVGGKPLDTSIVEHFVIDLTNRERQRGGLPPLLQDERISQIARNHSKNMAAYGYSHTVLGKGPSDRAKDAGYNCRGLLPGGRTTYGLSENIALQPRITEWQHQFILLLAIRDITEHHKTEWDAAKALVEAWMNSPGHRANILNPRSTRIGVGIHTEVEEADLGIINEHLYATQNFSGCT